MSTKVEYTLEDVGCYVDGSRGIYAVDAIVKFAESHGFECDLNNGRNEEGKVVCLSCDVAHKLVSNCEFSNEIEDNATAFMNENYPVSEWIDTSQGDDEANLVKVKAYWCRNEQGDWGLGLDD